MIKTSNFQPDWASPPGHTIEDALEELGMTQVDFSARMGLSKKHTNELIKGKVSLTPDVALKLETVLGSPATFWLRRELQFRESLARLAAQKQAEAHADWLDELPVRELIKLNWIKKCTNKGAQVLEALRFFGVASVAAWRQTCAQPGLAFRASPTFQKKLGAVMAWKRQAELAAAKVELAPFDRSALKNLLSELRKLSLQKEPAVLVPSLQRLCASCGVATVLVPAPAGCPVSGAAWFSTTDRAVIALSLRHKSNDHLWFSFFHEVGHLLLHGKKQQFLDGIGLDGLDPQKEREADNFAKRILFTDEAGYQTLAANGRISQSAVEAYAKKIGIAPGIVVGRLQYDKVLPPTHLNGLKVRYKWS